MPIIEIHLLEGRSTEQKRAVSAGVTDALVAALNVRREQVRILIHEVGPEDFSIAGETAGMRADGRGNGAANPDQSPADTESALPLSAERGPKAS